MTDLSELEGVKRRQKIVQDIVMNAELEGRVYADDPKNLKVIESAGDVVWCIETIQSQARQLADQAAMLEEVRGGMDAIASWMSAASDDPTVCDEMKADIDRFFAALAKLQPDTKAKP